MLFLLSVLAAQLLSKICGLKGDENEETPIWENPKKSLSCHGPLLCDPIGFNCNTLNDGDSGFMGLLCTDAPLSRTPYRDDAGSYITT